MAKEKEPKTKQKRAKKKDTEKSTVSTNAEQAIVNAELPETAAPAQPAPQPLQPALPQQPMPYTPRTSPQLILIVIGCIAGGVLFLLAICGGVLAYSIYQRPENVVLDAITKLQSANKFSTHTEITMDYKYDAGTKDVSFKKLTLDTGMNSSPSVDANATLQMSVGGRDVSVKASALMTDDGTIYFKVKNLAEALSAFTGSSKELPASAKNQLEKASNKWVKYEINDLYKNNQRAAERARCVQNVYKRSLKDSKKRREIVSTYRKYPFVMIESMAQPKDGNVGYTVWIEPVTWRQFNKAFAHTAIAQDIKACGPSTHDNSSVVPDDTDDNYANPAPSHSVLGHSKTKFTMWISPWSHELRALDIEGGSDARFSPKSHTKFDFSKGVATTKPNDSEVIHADEWNKRLNEAMNISNSSALLNDGS